MINCNPKIEIVWPKYFWSLFDDVNNLNIKRKSSSEKELDGLTEVLNLLIFSVSLCSRKEGKWTAKPTGLMTRHKIFLSMSFCYQWHHCQSHSQTTKVSLHGVSHQTFSIWIICCKHLNHFLSESKSPLIYSITSDHFTGVKQNRL